MKPLKLDLHAFGPFARHQVVDFRQLGAKTFFLIHGPTGAGKTSILDGMCFALFGDSSGGEREGRQMRSHHADEATPTQVGFAFSLGGSTFRVTRMPEQMRPSQRGGGETKQAPKAELQRIETVDGIETAHPLAAGWEKVNKAVVELLGFESKQFRQVIMLPQGRFFEFLKSTSAEREKILQTLFGTELYKRIEQRLKDAATQLAREAEGVRTQRQALLAQGEVADEAALGERHRAQAEGLRQRREAEAAAAQAAQRAEDSLVAAQGIASRFDELDRAGVALRLLDARSEQRAAEQAVLDAARRAAGLQPHAAVLDMLDERIAEAAREAGRLAVRQAECAAALVRAEASRGREQARLPEVDAAIARLAELDALQARVASLADARREQAAAQGHAMKTGSEAEAARAAQRRATEAFEARNRQLQEARVQAAALDGARAGRHQVASQLAQATSLSARLVELAAAERRQATEQARAESADADCHAARVRRDALRRDWVAGLANRLARALADGAPCPVCGSLDHPHAAASDAALVDDEAMDAAEAVLTRAERVQREAADALAESRQAVVVLHAQVADLQRSIGDAPIAIADLQARATAAQAALDKAEAASASLLGLEAAQAQARLALDAAGQAWQVADTASSSAQAKLQASHGLLAERLAGIPPDLAEPAALAAAREHAVKQRDGLRQALDAAVAAATQAGIAAAEAATRQQSHAASTKSLAEQRDAQAGVFAQRSQEAGFVDTEAFRRALLDPHALTTRQHALDADVAACAAARDRHARAQAETQALARPDLPSLAAAHAAAKATRLAASNAVVDLQAALKTTTALVDSLARMAEAYRAVEARYGAVQRVAEVAGGDNPQRMSFQRYVLATLLEEVLAATSLRLRAMSRGRYEIRRSLQAAHQRGAAGLDLEVHDQYTGTQRAVATLSGGESFLASLSLALGLSDVVQSHAGGVRLEAIFVDEGFGTLDAESLDVAIRALQDLQQAGRMVGIISHVAELREWVDARLELKATPKGSVAEFVC